MRSRLFFISNIIATLYAACLLFIFGQSLISAREMGGFWQPYSDVVFSLFSSDSASMTVVYVFVALFLAHICAIITGAILGWIGYFRVKSTLAKSAAVLYLIAAICFPLCFVFAIPITIFGFLGSGDQKELNKIAAMESQNFRSTSI